LHVVLLRRGSRSELSCGSRQDFVDGEVSGAAEGEGDDLGDVVGADRGVAVLLPRLANCRVGGLSCRDEDMSLSAAKDRTFKTVRPNLRIASGTVPIADGHRCESPEPSRLTIRSRRP